MDSKAFVGIGIVAALGLAAYLWYTGLPSTLAPAAEQSATSSPPSAEEHAASLAPAALRAEVTGSWQSADDPKFTRVFRADGTVTDRYEGNPDATLSGSWRVIADGEGLPASLSAEERTIIRVSFPEEVLFFVVTALTEDELEMAYVGGGGSLRFTRIAP